MPDGRRFCMPKWGVDWGRGEEGRGGKSCLGSYPCGRLANSGIRQYRAFSDYSKYCGRWVRPVPRQQGNTLLLGAEPLW